MAFENTITEFEMDAKTQQLVQSLRSGEQEHAAAARPQFLPHCTGLAGHGDGQ
jgi:hypothetical protein